MLPQSVALRLMVRVVEGHPNRIIGRTAQGRAADCDIGLDESALMPGLVQLSTTLQSCKLSQ